MKAVLFSIKPKYCELIANGKKTVEVRKTRPKLDKPFKCYIYCTKAREVFSFGGGLLGASDQLYRLPTGEIKYGDSIELMCCNHEYSKDNFLNGKVIGEFVCDSIFPLWEGYAGNNGNDCLTFEEQENYLNGKQGFGLHISDLVIYDNPKELVEFRKPCIYGDESDVSCFLCDKSGYRPDMHIDCFNEVTRPPQSWCYVEEVS